MEEAEMAEEAEAETDAALLAAVEDKDGQVDKLVAAKKLEEALTVALADPPIGTKDREIKDLACSTVLRVIAATKDKEIEALVTGVSDTEEDVLMKYLYALMEGADEWAKLHKWHEKLVAKAGLGCIVRALTDRKTVMKLASGTAGAATYSDATR